MCLNWLKVLEFCSLGILTPSTIIHSVLAFLFLQADLNNLWSHTGTLWYFLYRRCDIPFGPGADLAQAFSISFLVSFNVGDLLLNAFVSLPSSIRPEMLSGVSFWDCEYVSLKYCSVMFLLIVRFLTLVAQTASLRIGRGLCRSGHTSFPAYFSFSSHLPLCLGHYVWFSSLVSVHTGLDAQYQRQSSYFSESCLPSCSVVSISEVASLFFASKYFP